MVLGDSVDKRETEEKVIRFVDIVLKPSFCEGYDTGYP